MEIVRSGRKPVLIQNKLVLKNDENASWKDETGNDTQVLEYLTFPGLSFLSGVQHLFSTRLGGVSREYLSSMNLSYARGDEPDNVTENFRRIATVFGKSPSDIVCTDQTHTANVRLVTKQDAGCGITKKHQYHDIDGIFTNEKGLILAAFFADCVPLFFVDPVKEVIGLAHSGWRGTVMRIGEVMVRKMTETFGCEPSDIRAAIGPSICRDCYEVSRDVADAFLAHREENAKDFSKVFSQIGEEQIATGKYQMDLWKANELVLLDAGILPQHLEVTDLCTSHNPQYLFSHRKTNGKRGNLGAFLMLRDFTVL